MQAGQYFVRVPLGDITVVPAPEQDGAYSPNTVVTLTAEPKVSGVMETGTAGVVLSKGGGLVWVGVDFGQGGTATIQMLEDRSVEVQPAYTAPHPVVPCG